MENVHPAMEEDDLYSGYNDYNPTFDCEDLENDVGFQQAVRTSHGRRPSMTAKFPGTAIGGRPLASSSGMTAKFPGTAIGGRPLASSSGMTAKFPGTAIGGRPLASSSGSQVPMASSMGRPMTGTVQDGATGPMTAVRAAGYTSSLTRGSNFDPLGQSRGPAPPLEAKNEDTPEEKVKILEKKVNDLIEESCIAQRMGALQLALEKAKEAGKKERVLERQRQQYDCGDNLYLSYSSQVPMASSMGRPMTGTVQDGATGPMTAVRAAGYTSSLTRGSNFDPLGQSRGPAPPLEAKNEDTPEEKVKILEKEVNDLIEESCIAQSMGALQLALEKAKEAGKKERVLERQRQQYDFGDNLYLSYSVSLNLANQYANNEMYPEALNTYYFIMENKAHSNAGLLKVNIANIYVQQKNYQKAIKFYRMALDQTSNAHKEMRVKIMQNIGLVFVRMGQYSDAMTSFEHIMRESPNIKTAFNLVLCYYAIGDRERMKMAFQKLISVPLGIDDEDKYTPSNDDTVSNMGIEAIKNDKLHQMERNLKTQAEKNIMTAAKLIAPKIETSFASGFDWCVDMVKSSQYVELANDLEMNKAIIYLKEKDFNQAAKILKTLEKKDSGVKSAAATNLSFLYFHEKDYDQSDRYADLAMNADRYNPAALTNKGNNVFIQQDYEKAAEFYKEALRNDSSCTEALYNLGLTYKKLNHLEEARDCFLKLHAILRNSAQVMYQLANLGLICELLEDPQQAIKWLMQVISVTPTDPHALAKLGELHDGEGDKSQAFHYYYESFRYFPSNIDVIEWLGAYYVETQFYEKAIQYLERATLIQPTQVKWQLMVASCYRRSGNYQKALETYKDIHRKFPENVKCLQFLVRLCTDMGLKEVQDYANKLKKVEKMKEIREQRVKSGREGSARGRREGREGSAGSADSSHSSNSTKGEQLSAKMRSLPGSNEPYEASSPKEIDASYVDPLGPQMERPKTGAKKRVEDDDFADEELGADLLPE